MTGNLLKNSYPSNSELRYLKRSRNTPLFFIYFNQYARVVHLVECLLPKEKVAGSSPVSRSTTLEYTYHFCYNTIAYAGVAQLVEHSLRKGKVVGSNPSTSF